MLMTAEFSALPAICARLVRLEPHRILVSRNQIALAMEVRGPKAVNHVYRRCLDHHRLSHGNMNLIRRDYCLISLCGFVSNFPPPLVADNVNSDRIF